eukprot:6092831-Pleurochrysis_carterae.AAC.3
MSSALRWRRSARGGMYSHRSLRMMRAPRAECCLPPKSQTEPLGEQLRHARQRQGEARVKGGGGVHRKQSETGRAGEPRGKREAAPGARAHPHPWPTTRRMRFLGRAHLSVCPDLRLGHRSSTSSCTAGRAPSSGGPNRCHLRLSRCSTHSSSLSTTCRRPRAPCPALSPSSDRSSCPPNISIILCIPPPKSAPPSWPCMPP